MQREERTEDRTEVDYVANHWKYLQPHIREAIMTLVDGALTSEFGPSTKTGVNNRTGQQAA